MIDVHQNAALSESFEGDRSRVIGNRCNIPSYQSAVGQRTFLYRAIKLWNSLPRAITAADSLRSFKKKLRDVLFESFLVS